MMMMMMIGSSSRSFNAAATVITGHGLLIVIAQKHGTDLLGNLGRMYLPSGVHEYHVGQVVVLLLLVVFWES